MGGGWIEISSVHVCTCTSTYSYFYYCCMWICKSLRFMFTCTPTMKLKIYMYAAFLTFKTLFFNLYIMVAILNMICTLKQFQSDHLNSFLRLSPPSIERWWLKSILTWQPRTSKPFYSCRKKKQSNWVTIGHGLVSNVYYHLQCTHNMQHVTFTCSYTFQ